MVDLGYFTTLEKKIIREYEKINTLTISNKKIRKEIRRKLYDLYFLKNKFRVSDSDIHSHIQSIVNLRNQSSTYEESGKAVLSLFKNK